MTEQDVPEPREESLTDPSLQEEGELPEPETGNDDADDTEPTEPADTGETEEEETDG